MKKETYVKRMKANEERFDKLWRKIVDDTNKYIEKNPEDSMYGFQNNVLNK